MWLWRAVLCVFGDAEHRVCMQYERVEPVILCARDPASRGNEGDTVCLLQSKSDYATITTNRDSFVVITGCGPMRGGVVQTGKREVAQSRVV